MTSGPSSSPAGPPVDEPDARADLELAEATPPAGWAAVGLRGPRIVLRWFGRNLRRLAVLVLGVTVLVVGAILIVLPGPGVLVILAGLAILATEFAWAERAMNRTLATAGRAAGSVAGHRTGRALLALSATFLVLAGLVVLVFGGTWRWSGLGLLVAGIVAFAVLHPRFVGWLDSKQP